MLAAWRCWRPSRQACRSSNTHPPRSSVPWSATGARKNRRCSRWSSCCWVWLKCPRPTMPPTRWRSPSAMCTRNGRRGRSAAARPHAARPRAGGIIDRCGDAQCIAGRMPPDFYHGLPVPSSALRATRRSPGTDSGPRTDPGSGTDQEQRTKAQGRRDRPSPRQHPRKTSEPHRRRRQRRRVRRVRAALDLLRTRRSRFRYRAADSHARPRRCAHAVRVRHAAGAGAVRAPDWRQRDRAEAGARRTLGDRADRVDARDRAWRHRAPHRDPRRRQENVRADRARAQGASAARAGRDRGGRRWRGGRARAARRCALGAREPGVSSATRRKSRRSRDEDARIDLRCRLRAHVEAGVTGSGQVTDDRLVTAARVDEDAQYEAGLRPRLLDEYIGQDRIRENLHVAIAAAKQRGEPLDHVLLHGPPGLGKTTLAYVIGNEMGVPVRATSGPAIEKPGDLVGIVTNLAANEVLFIDEIHRMSPAVEEILYPALEHYEVDIAIGQGPSARTVKMRLERFTLIGATTRTGLLTSPLRSRFGIVHRLEFYAAADLEEIVRRSAKILSVPIDDAAAAEIARRARGTPRIANRLLRRVRDYAQVRADGTITLPVARAGLQLLEVDEHGFDEIDRKLLHTIIDKFRGGPVGLNTIAAAISEEKDAIEDIYEPFLLQIGFLDRTPRGRVATPAAYGYFGLAAPADQRRDSRLW